MSLYVNRKKHLSNEAPLAALTRTPPMSAEQHAMLRQKRTEQRRQAEAKREARTEALKDSW